MDIAIRSACVKNGPKSKLLTKKNVQYSSADRKANLINK